MSVLGRFLRLSAFVVLTVSISASVAAASGKYLILHDLPHAQATPAYLKTNHAYLDTLPLDGIAVYVTGSEGNISGTALQPTAISLSAIQGVLAPLQGLSWNTMKHNFGLLYFGPGWPDAFDDSKWAIVTQNMANYAQAAQAAGLTGIFFDNENYSRYGNYGDATCGSPHTLQDCQAKMIQRGNQIMKAMIAQFPNIVVLFFHDTYISDNTFYQQPPFTSGDDFSNNVAHANLLVGPFAVGLVQAAQGTQATTVGGGEDPGFGAKTPQDFSAIYQYQKFGQASDSLAGNDSASRSAGPNGYIPPSLRPVWSNLYSGGVAVYDINNLNPANNMPTTLASTITNALNQVDQYAWLYMEVWDANANPPHPSMLIPPGSAPDAAPQAWIDAVRAGRQAAASASTPVLAPPAPPVPPPSTSATAMSIKDNLSPARCLDIPNSSTTLGTGVEIWDCNGGVNQQFHFISATGEIRVYGDTLCVDAKGASSTDQTPIILWQCNGGANQKWTFNPAAKTIVGNSGKCLDIPHSAAANGTFLQLFTCNGGMNQQFSVGTASGQTPDLANLSVTDNLNPGRCLDIPNSSTAPGTGVEIWDCNGGANQQFHFVSATGEIKAYNDTLCMDAKGASSADQTPVILWQCNGGANQKWTYNLITKTIVGSGGKCLDIPWSNAANGTFLQLYACNGGTNQQFNLGAP